MCSDRATREPERGQSTPVCGRNSRQVKVKRVYDAPARSDGHRTLVDRLWPRGLSREAAKLDAWEKELAPSAELRTWFAHAPSKWIPFKRRYFRELDQRKGAIQKLLDTCSRRTVTLLFAAKDTARNNAVVLKEYVDEQLEPRA